VKVMASLKEYDCAQKREQPRDSENPASAGPLEGLAVMRHEMKADSRAPRGRLPGSSGDDRAFTPLVRKKYRQCADYRHEFAYCT